MKANYYMQFTNIAKNNSKASKSFQREQQRNLDMPVLLYFSHDFQLPMNASFNHHSMSNNLTIIQQMSAQVQQFNLSQMLNGTNATNASSAAAATPKPPALS